MKKLIFVLFFMILTSPAYAVIYRWVDQKGVLNFTDDYDKIPPDYHDGVEKVDVPKMRSPTLSQVVANPSGQNMTKAPPIEQGLVREGFFAVKLVEALRMEPAKTEAEAETMLASVGIAPRNGWIADYPVTPDIIGELQNTIAGAVDSRKLAVNKDEAMRTFQDLIAQQGLPVRVASGSQDTGVEQPYAGETPPPNYPEYYEPSVIDNYYYDQGPPIVTYYPPPSDYSYLYAWVPYPFLCTGFWFPGFFVLHDFHRGFIVNGNVRFVSNHFWDSRTRGFGTIDPARRHMGNAMANISPPTRGFASHAVSNSASSIVRRSLEHTVNRPTGPTSGNREMSGLSNPRGGPNGDRSPTGYRPPSTGYSPSSRIPFSRPTYGGSLGHSGSFSQPGMGSARSFSPPHSSGSFGFNSGGSGGRGITGGGSRGFSGRGGRGR